MSNQNPTLLAQQARGAAAQPYQGAGGSSNFRPNPYLMKQMQGMGVQNPFNMLGGGQNYNFSPLGFTGIQPYVAPVEQTYSAPENPAGLTNPYGGDGP